MIDVRPVPRVAKQLSLRLAQLPRLLGYDPGREPSVAALAALGLEPESAGPDRVQVTVPSWRVDLTREVDLVEEVARHLGYDRIPTATEGIPTRIGSGGRERLENPARDYLAGHGFHEAFGYAMIAAEEDDTFVASEIRPGLRLTNPISEAQSELRRSLLPGLLRAVDLNLRRGVSDVRLFEVGPVFLPADDGVAPAEPLRVALAWTGSARPRHWSEPVSDVSVFDLLGLIEGLLLALRPGCVRTREACERPGLHPTLAACWRSDSDDSLAWAGLLDPASRSGIGTDVWIAEIDLDAISRLPVVEVQFTPIPRLTEVTRDLAVVLRRDVDYASVVDAFRPIAAPAPISFDAVDRYEGPPLADGESSLTVRVTLRPDDRALTESEIEGYRTALIEVLERDLRLRIRGD